MLLFECVVKTMVNYVVSLRNRTVPSVPGLGHSKLKIDPHVKLIMSDQKPTKLLTYATIESLTGGNVASLLTSRDGSSEHFEGGTICYMEKVKRSQLNIPQNVIDKGYASPVLARALAHSGARLYDADIIIATTGYIDNRFGLRASFVVCVMKDYKCNTMEYVFSDNDMTRTERQKLAALLAIKYAYDLHNDPWLTGLPSP